MTCENWGKHKNNWQIDHIKPLCQFDLTDEKQVKQACHYTNLRPLWYSEHKEKSKNEKKLNKK